jgi:hypothetical protein
MPAASARSDRDRRRRCYRHTDGGVSVLATGNVPGIGDVTGGVVIRIPVDGRPAGRVCISAGHGLAGPCIILVQSWPWCDKRIDPTH